MTTSTISTLARRTEAELSDMIAKAEGWIATVGTSRERSEAEIAMARATITAIAHEHRRRREETWRTQSTGSQGERAAAAFAHRPLDRSERRLLSILLDEGNPTQGELATRIGCRGGGSPFGSIVSERAEFFEQPTDTEIEPTVRMLHLVERIDDGGAIHLRLRDDVRDAVARAVREHDIEMERRRRVRGR